LTSRKLLGGTGQPGRQVNGTSAGLSGLEIAAENGGTAAAVTRAAEARGDAARDRLGTGTFPPDSRFDAEADAATEDMRVAGAATAAGLVAAPHAVSVATLVTKISACGIA